MTPEKNTFIGFEAASCIIWHFQVVFKGTTFRPDSHISTEIRMFTCDLGTYLKMDMNKVKWMQKPATIRVWEAMGKWIKKENPCN